MTKEQANEEIHKLMKERIKRADELINEAKKNGTWLSGLDSNRALFEPLKKEIWGKIQQIQAQIDK